MIAPVWFLIVNKYRHMITNTSKMISSVFLVFTFKKLASHHLTNELSAMIGSYVPSWLFSVGLGCFAFQTLLENLKRASYWDRTVKSRAKRLPLNLLVSRHSDQKMRTRSLRWHLRPLPFPSRCNRASRYIHRTSKAPRFRSPCGSGIHTTNGYRNRRLVWSRERKDEAENLEGWPWAQSDLDLGRCCARNAKTH